jgi:ABC-type multidrug transport system fused ATPase/permease subunit
MRSGPASVLRARITVFIEDTDYNTMPPRELRRQVAMVTHRPLLFPGTVTGNLRFGPAQRGALLPDSRVDELLARVALRGYGDRDVANSRPPPCISSAWTAARRSGRTK